MTRVFIGLENVNPENLAAARKRQNRITEYRAMLQAWKSRGIMTLAGYILGFPADTPETIRRDIEIIKRELPVDLVEFFCLTPLPGSEDHRALWRSGAALDPDLNRYDVEHVCTDHPRMSRAEWEAIYREAWSLYYTPEHMVTVLKRAAATGVRTKSIAKLLIWFSTSVAVEKVHPLQGGVLRLRSRHDRRPGLPIEPAWKFYPREAWSIVSKTARLALLLLKLERQRRAIETDPERKSYVDQALMPVTDADEENLELFTQNEAAKHAVQHAHRIDELTHRVA